VSIRNRLPQLSQLLAVYAIGTIFIYTWTLLWFFWKLPSWLFYLNLGEILTSLAYALTLNLFEAVLAASIPVLVAFILPHKWFLETFIARGATLLASLLAYTAYVLYRFPVKEEPPLHLMTTRTPQILIATVLLVFAAGRLPFLRKTIESIADRAIVLLYLFVPMSLISALVVLIRNIF
jgi:hypothetical protein